MYLFYLAAFFGSSVVIHGALWSSEVDVKREMEQVGQTLQEVMRSVSGNSTWKIPYKCCMCKESLRLTRFLIMNELQEKAEDMCSLVLIARDQCMRKAKIYQDKILRALFPGGPYGMCKSLKACK